LEGRRIAVSSFVYTKELKHSIVLLILFAFLLTGCVSTAAGDTGPKGVLIESKADVGQNEVEDFQASASETVKYYQEVGLFLKQPVTIVLTRNRKSFLAEAALRFGISEIEVNRVGKGVDALSGNGLIVINADGTPTPRQRTFLVAHELTHQYQRQIAGSKAGEIMWMLEGMAEAVGAQVVARQGFMSVEQYKTNWQNGIRIANHKPLLSALYTRRDWSNALSAYGSGLTYKTAGFSNLVLLERYSIQQILKYFTVLGRGGNAADAFFDSFGVSILNFEKSIEMLLRKVS
jgi:hypothetical protein